MSVAVAIHASGDRDPGQHVSGGSRGLTVEYRELQAAAGELDRITERLEGIRDRGVGVCFKLYGLNGASALPAAAGTAADAVNDAVLSLRRNIEDLEDAATSLRKAVDNYLDVEGRLEQSLKAVPGAAPVTAFALWSLGGGGYPGRAVPELLIPKPDSLIGGFFTVSGFLVSAGLPSLTVSKVAGTHGKIPAPRTALGLLQRSRILLETESNSHVVEILTIKKDGRDVRVVTLPGTQGDPGLNVGENPFDTYGNVEGVGGDSRYVAEAVVEALRQSGASPSDSVILTGYSLGGIHAVNIAARLEQDGGFTMEMVLTAGAPRGGRDLPEGVRALHLEHVEDWVTGADGASNADTPDRITVTGTTPVPEGAGGGLGPAHQLDVYLDLAARADASGDPSLEESLGHLAELIGPGTIATRSLFQFSRTSGQTPTRSPGRTPSPSPQAPPRPPPKRPFGPGSGLPPSNPVPSRGGTAPLPGPGGTRLPPVLTNPVAPLGRWLPAGPGQ